MTIGYGDRAGYDETDPSVRDVAHPHDARLQTEDALLRTAGAPEQAL